jgi:hypothetical protein
MRHTCMRARKFTRGMIGMKERKVKESDIEAYLCNRVKAAGGRAYKWVSPGNVGVPDRIVSFPGDKIVFVELKAPGKKPTPIQQLQATRLTNNGHEVIIIDSKERVDVFIKYYGGGDS